MDVPDLYITWSHTYTSDDIAKVPGFTAFLPSFFSAGVYVQVALTPKGDELRLTVGASCRTHKITIAFDLIDLYSCSWIVSIRGGRRSLYQQWTRVHQRSLASNNVQLKAPINRFITLLSGQAISAHHEIMSFSSSLCYKRYSRRNHAISL